MRIVSLLPSLTELVCSLGRRDDLVGVSHECDYPPGVEKLPQLTKSKIPPHASASEIDTIVRDNPGSLYELDTALLAESNPDLILTQEQCDVCAVNEAMVRQVAAQLPQSPRVESINPLSLAGVYDVFRRVGRLIQSEASAEAMIHAIESASRRIIERLSASSPSPPPRVALLEWLEPPYCSGHWNPELIALAGGVEVIGPSGFPSRRVTWEEVAASAPSLIIFSPCGFTLERTESEFAVFRRSPEWQVLTKGGSVEIVLVDGSAYFSRPGPRLEKSLRIAAAAIHPECCLDLAPPEGEGWRRILSKTRM